MAYTVNFELYDVDKTTKLNPLEYETLNELIGKHLKLVIELKKATEIPDKYNYKMMCKYIYDGGEFETAVIEKSKEPKFDYHGEHMQVITDDMVQHLMYNTLTVGVYGMIESKKPNKEEANDEQFRSTLMRLKTSKKFESTGDEEVDKRLLNLER